MIKINSMEHFLSVGHYTEHLIHICNHHHSFERHIWSVGSRCLTWGMSSQKWPKKLRLGKKNVWTGPQRVVHSGSWMRSQVAGDVSPCPHPWWWDTPAAPRAWCELVYKYPSSLTPWAGSHEIQIHLQPPELPMRLRRCVGTPALLDAVPFSRITASWSHFPNTQFAPDSSQGQLLGQLKWRLPTMLESLCLLFGRGNGGSRSHGSFLHALSGGYWGSHQVMILHVHPQNQRAGPCGRIFPGILHHQLQCCKYHSFLSHRWNSREHEVVNTVVPPLSVCPLQSTAVWKLTISFWCMVRRPVRAQGYITTPASFTSFHLITQMLYHPTSS